MADERNDNRTGRMDLNLYLGVPRFPRPQSSDLGSDLALNSISLSTSSTTEESCTPIEMSHPLEPTAHAPYSPSYASFTRDPSFRPADFGADSDQEYNPLSPSYGPYAPIPSMLAESEELGTSDSPPSTAHPLSTLHETEEPVIYPPRTRFEASCSPLFVPHSESYLPLDTREANDDLHTMSSLIGPYVDSLFSDVSMYAPPMPSYVPRFSSDSPRDRERDGESSLRHDLTESPEYRFRRLIESSHQRMVASSHRLRLRRFRSSLSYHGDSRRTNLPRSASPDHEQQAMHDIMSPQRLLETNGKHKVPAEGIAAECLEEEKGEKSQTTANFECNICLDMAQDPVVTSCGHLFCWPCLYQWLHVHSEHKECPVCKGEVTEGNITPIYGRGNSEASAGKKLAECGGSNMKIPPRPRGNRFESLRQQLRPISRRLGEGIMTSWRRLVNQQMRNRHRFEGHGDSSLPEMFNGAYHAVLTRLRARRQVREALNAEIEREVEDIALPSERMAIPQSSYTHSLFRDGTDLWHQHRENPVLPRGRDFSRLHQGGMDFFHLGEGTTTIHQGNGMHPLFRDGISQWQWPRDSTVIPQGTDIEPFSDRASVWHQFNAYGPYATADIERVVGNGIRHGASTSSVNPRSPEQQIPRASLVPASVADQVSASSTIREIQGDIGLQEGSAAPNGAGSSRSTYRRRGRTSASGSLDVDGALHACKRRRLN